MRRLVFLAPALVLGLAGAARPAAAQLDLVSRCALAGDEAARATCASLAQAALIAQGRLGLVAAGGNPLPGSTSTLGKRLGSTPRVALQLRATGARATLPPVAGAMGGSVLITSIDADAAVGIIEGASPTATVGGVGAFDLVGSVGILPSPGKGFRGSPATGAIGVRLGVLRESFTAPGITLSGVYRRVGSSTFGSAGGDAARLEHIDDLSLRAVVGKRLLSLATSAGVGWDHTSGDVTISPRPCTGCTLASVAGPLSQGRLNAFANLTWISLVFSGTAELGWQRGGSPAVVAPTPTGHEDLVRKGGLFGSLALRLTI